MSDPVAWLVDHSIKPGQLDNFKALVEEMVQSTLSKPNTLTYEWFLSEDNGSCDRYERFVDSAAAMTRLGNFGEKFAERSLALVEVKQCIVYGAPDDEVKAVLGGFGTTFKGSLNGFAR